jgi:hypothetical protein
MRNFVGKLLLLGGFFFSFGIAAFRPPQLLPAIDDLFVLEHSIVLLYALPDRVRLYKLIDSGENYPWL